MMHWVKRRPKRMCEIWWRVFSVGVKKSGVLRYWYGTTCRLGGPIHLVLNTKGRISNTTMR